MIGRSVRRRTGVAALLASASLLVTADPSAAAAPARPGGGPVCRYPAPDTPESWQPVPAPAMPLVSVGQLDRDPCLLLAAGTDGSAWRSRDAGAHWEQAAGPLGRVLTEGLELPVGGSFAGPVVATRPVAGELPEVVVSADDGASWQPATGPGGAPLRATVHAAAAGAHYTKNERQTWVYLAAETRTDPVPVDLVPGLGIGELVPALTPLAPVLLRSADGGRSYAIVEDTNKLAPSVVAVSPVAVDEVWVNDTTPGRGGAWRSFDGGGSFKLVCCDAGVTVSDITFTPLPDGAVQVLLATSQGLRRSGDSGTTWNAVAGGDGVSGVRTAPESPDTVLAQTADAVRFRAGPKAEFRRTTGLPDDCRPTGLRRTATVPATFLVECGTRTFRFTPRAYRPSASRNDDDTTTLPPSPPPPGAPSQELRELATWRLPDSAPRSGAIAFDGVHLLYDVERFGVLRAVRAADGAPRPPVVLRNWPFGYRINGLTFDMRRNHVLVTDDQRDLFTYDVAARTTRLVNMVQTDVPSYDSWFNGLSWIEEGGTELYRTPRTGGFGYQPICAIDPLSWVARTTSTYVAAGDGGGYVQLEDDESIFRVDRQCRVTGGYAHRRFSESGYENDAMACDTQTFFPQAAIWIRDSEPQTATAYAVPYGYCPMPSQLALTAPALLRQGKASTLCVRLVNATTGVAAAGRPVTLSVRDVVVGRGRTDAQGGLCVPWTPALDGTIRRVDRVTARFAGDAGLYPSTTTADVVVVRDLVAPPPPRVVPAVVPPPIPPLPPVPPVPAPVPAPAGAPAPAPAPNLGQAPAAQAQPVAQGVVVPEKQTQPQLALARAAARVNAELERSGVNPMTALPDERRGPRLPGLPAVVGLAAMCAFGGWLSRSPALARVRGRTNRGTR